MSFQQMLLMLPDVQPDELAVIQELTRNMTDLQKEQFMMMYRGKRKDKQTMLLLTAIGFLGVAGIQRFIVGDIALGILFFLTVGFCFIGTIIDIVNIGELTFEFNRKQAIEAAGMVRTLGV